MTEPLTAEWCREGAEVLANAAASMLKGFENPEQVLAAMREGE